MLQSSDENKVEEKISREELTAKERRRLQNRIAQRNHRRKKAQLSGNEERKSRERSMAHVDVQIQPGNNVKYNEQALDADSGNTHGSLVLAHPPLFNKARHCGTANIHEHYHPIPTVWPSDNRILSHGSCSSQNLQGAKEMCGRNTTAGNVWRDQDTPQKAGGVASPHFADDVGKLGYLVTNSPDFNAPFDGTDSDISSPTAHSYTPTLATIESCPSLSSAQTPISEDDLSLIGVPPGWPGNIFGRPRRLRSYSENTGKISQNSPFRMHPENLIEHNRSQSDTEGKMALHLSAENGHANIVRCLLDFGSEIDRPDGSGATALHYAAATGNVDVISILLERGADGNITDIQGRTALHIAAERGHETAVKILIQSGVSVDIQIQRK
ncbi:hypothetical protein GX51_01954 [Blastomyces parvus]|uniref:BZIP domain-containing protein n=1 Tax=Blastomyces parvus TaxID=2060905 RepID=A0A2B7XES8_9EURO|nr:hypothetical protein GX51_01954 [Blastomyces parvus]